MSNPIIDPKFIQSFISSGFYVFIDKYISDKLPNIIVVKGKKELNEENKKMEFQQYANITSFFMLNDYVISPIVRYFFAPFMSKMNFVKFTEKMIFDSLSFSVLLLAFEYQLSLKELILILSSVSVGDIAAGFLQHIEKTKPQAHNVHGKAILTD